MGMLTRFSTESLPSEQRHDAWINRGGAGIGRLVDARPDGAFDMWSDLIQKGVDPLLG